MCLYMDCKCLVSLPFWLHHLLFMLPQTIKFNDQEYIVKLPFLLTFFFSIAFKLMKILTGKLID